MYIMCVIIWNSDVFFLRDIYDANGAGNMHGNMGVVVKQNILIVFVLVGKMVVIVNDIVNGNMLL